MCSCIASLHYMYTTLINNFQSNTNCPVQHRHCRAETPHLPGPRWWWEYDRVQLHEHCQPGIRAGCYQRLCPPEEGEHQSTEASPTAGHGHDEMEDFPVALAHRVDPTAYLHHFNVQHWDFGPQNWAKQLLEQNNSPSQTRRRRHEEVPSRNCGNDHPGFNTVDFLSSGWNCSIQFLYDWGCGKLFNMEGSFFPNWNKRTRKWNKATKNRTEESKDIQNYQQILLPYSNVHEGNGELAAIADHHNKVIILYITI